MKKLKQYDWEYDELDRVHRCIERRDGEWVKVEDVNNLKCDGCEHLYCGNRCDLDIGNHCIRRAEDYYE